MRCLEWFVSPLPVIDFNIRVSLWIVLEPHQLQVKDGRKLDEYNTLISLLGTTIKKDQIIIIMITVLFVCTIHSQMYKVKRPKVQVEPTQLKLTQNKQENDKEKVARWKCNVQVTKTSSLPIKQIKYKYIQIIYIKVIIQTIQILHRANNNPSSGMIFGHWKKSRKM